MAVGEVEELVSLAEALGCGITSFPSTYLGLPLGERNGSAKWNLVVEKVERRLATWKRPLLSKGGRITLIKSVLANIPVYHLSLFAIPMMVVKRIERIMRDFLWESREGEKKKYHLVAWDSIKKPKSEGGLGIRGIKEMNEALLGKWLWRFGEELDNLWRVVIREKYGLGHSRWITKVPRGTYGVGVWRAIFNTWHKFNTNIRITVHNGRDTLFWEDTWLFDEPLMKRFPLAYVLSRNKLKKVADLGQGGDWQLGLNRRVSEGVAEELVELLTALSDFNINDLEEDQRNWKWTANQCFTVSDFYSRVTPPSGTIFPTKFIWSPIIPPRISVFVWLAAHKSILTTENLNTRGWKLVNRCYLCMCNEETVDHLLLHCNFTKYIWHTFFLLFQARWMVAGSVKELISNWSTGSWRRRRKLLWALLPAAVMRSVWDERNARAFNNKESVVQQININVLAYMHVWSSISGDMAGVRLEDLLYQWQHTVLDNG